MTLELELYYANRFAMFSQPGWRQLLEDVAIMRMATDTLSGVTPETLQYKQGELSMMNWLLQLENTTKEAHADLSVQMPQRARLPADGTMGTEDESD